MPAFDPSTFLKKNGYGLALSLAVAVAAYVLEPLVKRATGGLGLPAMVIALFIGIALNRLASDRASSRASPGA